jgi:hypothetical protein
VQSDIHASWLRRLSITPRITSRLTKSARREASM